MNTNHIGQSFDSLLKEENIEIKEDEIKNTLDLMFDKLCAKEGMKRCESFIKVEESEGKNIIMLSVDEINKLQIENKRLNEIIDSYQPRIQRYKDVLQEIKGVVTALYMNNWLQMNETARKSVQLLQDLITKAEEE